MADGFSRWYLALEIFEAGRISADTLLSPFLSYFQAATYALTGSFGFYTLLQATAFYFAIGIQLRMLIGEKSFHLGYVSFRVWNLVAVAICLVPAVYVFPLMLTDSAPVYCLLVAGIWLCGSRLGYKAKALLGFATVLLCVGIRVNSAVLFGLVMVGFLIKAIQSKDKVWAIGASVIMAGCLAGAWLPGAVSPVKYNAGTLGMVWELTGMASQDKSLRQKLSAYGDVDEAMHRFGEPYLNSIVWDRNPPFPAQKIAGQYAKEITSLYFETAFQEPIHFAKNKWKWVSRTLGISDKLITSSRGVHGVDARTQSLGGRETYWHNRLRSSFFQTTDRLGFVSRCPWFAFFISIILLVITKVTALPMRHAIGMVAIAAGYYSSFCINTQAFEFRYWAPSLYLLLILMIGLFINIAWGFTTKSKLIISAICRIKSAFR